MIDFVNQILQYVLFNIYTFSSDIISEIFLLRYLLDIFSEKLFLPVTINYVSNFLDKIPQMPLDNFLKLFEFSFLFTVLQFGIQLIPQILAWKKNLEDNPPKDGETGVELIRPKYIRNLLSFDLERYDIKLAIAILLELVISIIYLTLASLATTVQNNIYIIFISILSWVSFLSILYPIYISIRIYIYYMKLLRVVMESKTKK